MTARSAKLQKYQDMNNLSCSSDGKFMKAYKVSWLDLARGCSREGVQLTVRSNLTRSLQKTANVSVLPDARQEDVVHPMSSDQSVQDTI
eukprot:3478128-Amphidinium_carterae.1